MKWTRFTSLAKRRGPRPDPDRRDRGLDTHLAFHRVLDARAEPECPICHLTRLRVERYFEGLLYEKVNDLSVRDRFRTAGGFCNSVMVKFLNDGQLKTALLSSDGLCLPHPGHDGAEAAK